MACVRILSMRTCCWFGLLVLAISALNAHAASLSRRQYGTAMSCSTWVSTMYGGSAAAACKSKTTVIVVTTLYTVVSNPDKVICMQNGDCADVCCVPVPPAALQACTLWASAGSTCGAGYVYSGNSGQQCNMDNSNCQATCCQQIQPVRTNCGAWLTAGGANTCAGINYIANPSALPTAQCTVSLGSDTCLQTCCKPNTPVATTQSCTQWAARVSSTVSGACGAGYTFQDSGANCASDNSNCQAVCCTQRTTCTQWAANMGGSSNVCGSNYAFNSGAASQLTCNPSLNSACFTTCCIPIINPAATTCGQFAAQSGGGASACGSGYAYAGSNNQQCGVNGSSCHDVCCFAVWPMQQSCSSWVVKKGGPTNACMIGSGPIGALDTTMCRGDNSDCQALCCQPFA